MSLLEALALFGLMMALAAMPSTSVALVVAKTIASGRRSGVLTAVGIVTGDLVFVALALLGVSTLAGWLGPLFGLLKALAGIYLVFLGINIFRASPQVSLPAQPLKQPRAKPVTDFLAGLVLTLGDIKALLFYASLFPLVVTVQGLSVLDALNITAITLVAGGGVKLAYVLFASAVSEQLDKRFQAGLPRRAGGIMLIACGSLLISRA